MTEAPHNHQESLEGLEDAVDAVNRVTARVERMNTRGHLGYMPIENGGPLFNAALDNIPNLLTRLTSTLDDPRIARVYDRLAHAGFYYAMIHVLQIEDDQPVAALLQAITDADQKAHKSGRHTALIGDLNEALRIIRAVLSPKNIEQTGEAKRHQASLFHPEALSQANQRNLQHRPSFFLHALHNALHGKVGVHTLKSSSMEWIRKWPNGKEVERLLTDLADLLRRHGEVLEKGGSVSLVSEPGRMSARKLLPETFRRVLIRMFRTGN